MKKPYHAWPELSPLQALVRVVGIGGDQTGAASPPYVTADAFRQLYEHAHRSVYHYIYSLLGGPAEDVEDLTAETFVRAWKNRRRFIGDEAAAVGWLITIARHLVIDTRRQSQRRGPVFTIDDAARDVPSDDCLERHVLSNEQHFLLLAALQALQERERELLVLRYVLGWQVKRIAEHFELPENTASVYIRRALQRLRSCWPESQEASE